MICHYNYVLRCFLDVQEWKTFLRMQHSNIYTIYRYHTNLDRPGSFRENSSQLKIYTGSCKHTMDNDGQKKKIDICHLRVFSPTLVTIRLRKQNLTKMRERERSFNCQLASRL